MSWVALIVYGLVYNQYFGWNWSPKSEAEVICDGIFAVAFIMTVKP